MRGGLHACGLACVWACVGLACVGARMQGAGDTAHGEQLRGRVRVCRRPPRGVSTLVICTTLRLSRGLSVPEMPSSRAPSGRAITLALDPPSITCPAPRNVSRTVGVGGEAPLVPPSRAPHPAHRPLTAIASSAAAERRGAAKRRRMGAGGGGSGTSVVAGRVASGGRRQVNGDVAVSVGLLCSPPPD